MSCGGGGGGGGGGLGTKGCFKFPYSKWLKAGWELELVLNPDPPWSVEGGSGYETRWEP